LRRPDHLLRLRQAGPPEPDCWRTLGNLRSLDAGFDRENLLFFAIGPATSGYSCDRMMNLYAAVMERLQSLSGVKSTSMSRSVQ